jgi:hypothetical protein
MVGLSLPDLINLSNKDNYASAKKVAHNRQLDKALIRVRSAMSLHGGHLLVQRMGVHETGSISELTAYGLHVKVASIPRDRDERYALADMLVPGTRGSSSPSNFIFARIDRHKLSAWPMCS